MLANNTDLANQETEHPGSGLESGTVKIRGRERGRKREKRSRRTCSFSHGDLVHEASTGLPRSIRKNTCWVS